MAWTTKSESERVGDWDTWAGSQKFCRREGGRDNRHKLIMVEEPQSVLSTFLPAARSRDVTAYFNCESCSLCKPLRTALLSGRRSLPSSNRVEASGVISSYTSCGSNFWAGFCCLYICHFRDPDKTSFGPASQASKFPTVEFSLLSQQNPVHQLLLHLVCTAESTWGRYSLLTKIAGDQHVRLTHVGPTTFKNGDKLILEWAGLSFLPFVSFCIQSDVLDTKLLWLLSGSTLEAEEGGHCGKDRQTRVTSSPNQWPWN